MARKLSLIVAAAFLLCGCVEREIAISTNPSGADVYLNGEHVGVSPVSARFNWYGTYEVQLKKQGFNTLNIAQEIERPKDDYFPRDIFAEIFSSEKLRRYSYSYDLTPAETVNRDALITNALEAANEAGQAAGGNGGADE